MANKKQENAYGKDFFIKFSSKMTTTQRMHWLEEARNFALKTIPKSSLRAYLKIKTAH